MGYTESWNKDILVYKEAPVNKAEVLCIKVFTVYSRDKFNFVFNC